MTAGGTVVTFEVAGGKRRCVPVVMNAFQLIGISIQSRRLEVAGHASGDHDTYAHR